MQPYQVKTVFYKYKNSPAIKLFLYMVFLLLFFFIALDSTVLMIIWAACLIVPPVVVAIKQKSFFSLRSWDDRSLILTADYVQVGEEQFDFKDIQTVAIYLAGYRDFGQVTSRTRGKEMIPVNGDDNVLAFRHKGATRSYEFFLRDFDSYVALCHIIDAWKNSGKSFVLKEQFSRDFIRGEIRRYQNLSV